MTTEAKLLALFGLVLAAMATPQWPQVFVWASAHPALASAGLVLVVLWAFVGPGRLRLRTPALFGNRQAERRYLRELTTRYDTFLALIAPSASRETKQRLKLDIAYISLTLRAEGDDDARPRPRVAQRPALFGRASSDLDDVEPTRNEHAGRALLLVAGYGLIGFMVLRTTLGALWPGGQFALSASGALIALAAVLLAAGAIWVLHRYVVPAVVQSWRWRRACTADPTSAEGQIWEQPRLLIKGAPGSGKTATLSHIALMCARDLLGERDGRGRSWVRERLGWPTAPFPILIPLRALRLAAAPGQGSLLDNYAAAIDLPAGCDGAFFQRRTARGDCLFLIDAVDELPDPQTRARLAHLVRTLPAGPVNRRNRVVVTTRPVGYDGALTRDFATRSVAPLAAEQAERFVRARYRALADQDRRLRDPGIRATNLLKRLPALPGLRRMTQNPLLLSLAVSLHYQHQSRELPNERYRLYGDACTMLIVEWEKQRQDEASGYMRDGASLPPPASYPLSDEQKLRLVYELAWAMYERSAERLGAESHTVILNPDAEQILAATLRTILNRHASDPAQLDELCRAEAIRWLGDLEQSGGLLRDYGYEHDASRVFRVQFIHQEFQSYLAARAVSAPYLSADERQSRHERLLARWDDPRLRELLLLYAAITNADPVLDRLQAGDLGEQLLAGDILLEYPLALDPARRAEVIATLRKLGLDTPDPSTSNALAALARLRDLEQLPPSNQLVAAFDRASDKLPLLECLGDMARNTPTNRRAAPQLCEALVALLERERAPAIRIATANAMARNDTRYEGAGLVPELVAVPGGEFIIGSDDGETDERPQHTRRLPAFWIGRAPVTNAQFRAFVQNGYDQRRFWSAAGWRWRTGGLELFNNKTLADPLSWFTILTRGLFEWPIGRLLKRTPFTAPWPDTWHDPQWNGDSQPVVGISRFEAEAYCRWLSERTNHLFRLPSEAEWEKAARGDTGREFPWGDTWHDGMCNSKETQIGRTTPVGSYPEGAGPYATQDIVGNVWEWCSGRWWPYRGGWSAEKFVYWVLVLLLDGIPIRGGSWYNDKASARGAARFNFHARNRGHGNGLRVASHAPPPDAGF